MKIQSIFTTAGILAIAMTSCTSDETVMKPETQIGQISYRVETPNITRVANNYSSNDVPTSFKVWAFDGENKYFGPDEMTSNDNGNTWTSDSDGRYWPKGKGEDWTGLDFFAFVDYDDDTNIDESGKKITNFKVKAEPENQLDLMYAVTEGMIPDSKNGGRVSLAFNHALSQICFTAQNNNTKCTSLTIQSISVNGVTDKGTFTPPTMTNPENGWELSEETDDVSKTYAIEGPSSAIAKPAIDSSTGDYESEAEKTNISVPASKGDGYSAKAMNLIPQELDNNVTLTVKYTVDSNECEENIPLEGEWKSGYRYTYNLKFEESAVAITYSVSVTDYTNADIEESFTDPFNGHEAVLMHIADDEIPYDLYFATCNLGAEKEEERGGYCWWGGTTLYYPNQDNHFDFNFDENNMSIITYGKTLDELKDNDIIDENGVLLPEYDAAHVQWSGLWRMPTEAELYWLSEKCEWKICDGNEGVIIWDTGIKNENTTKHTVMGIYAKSKETGNIIFFPAAGLVSNGNSFYNGVVGEYWCSTVSSDVNCAVNMGYNMNDTRGEVEDKDMYSGLSVRPVISIQKGVR